MIGIRPPAGPVSEVTPNGRGDDDGPISGSMARGMVKNDSSSSSQSSVSKSISMVRLALVTSVACTPPRGPR